MGSNAIRWLRTLSSTLVRLLDRLDDTDSHRLSHVTNSETTKRRVLVVGLDAHGLRRDELGNAGIARLDEFRGGFNRLTSTTIDLFNKFGELAGNVGGVAIQDWRVTSTNLTRVVENDDLSREGGSFLCRVVLGVRSNIPTTNFLNRDVPEK